MKKVLFVTFMVISIITAITSVRSKVTRQLEIMTECTEAAVEVGAMIKEQLMTEITYEQVSNYWEWKSHSL